MKFPWKLLITSIIMGIVLRPLFKNDLDYMIAGMTSGAILAVLNEVLDLGLTK